MPTVETAARPVPLEEGPCPVCGDTAGPVVAEGRDFEYDTTDLTFRFVACAGCGALLLRPRPAAAALAVIYPPHYYAFTGEEEGRGLVRMLRARWELNKVRDYARWLDPGPRRVLDVGCGRGRLLSLFQRGGRAEWELWGIDLDPAAVAATRAKGFRAEVSTIEAFAPAERFDLILLQQVIEHVADPVGVLRRLHTLLAPGGVVMLETPNPGGWDFRLFHRRLWGGYHFPRHFTLFTPNALARAARDAGFEVVAIRPLVSLSFWTWSFHHWLLTRGAPAALVRWCRPPNALLLAATAPLELLQLALGLPTSNQRLIARRPVG